LLQGLRKGGQPRLPSASSAGNGVSTPTRRMRSRCCALAANGQAAADPAIPLMRSRRRIARPGTEDYASNPDYIRDLSSAKWALEAWLHGRKLELWMTSSGR
jgi:hypothetical protein